jgi:hydrogenase maturation protease
MNPVAVLQLVRSFGGSPRELYLVGCEPEVLESEELGLSKKVQAAIPTALDMIGELLRKLLHETKDDPKNGAGLETRTERSNPA